MPEEPKGAVLVRSGALTTPLSEAYLAAPELLLTGEALMVHTANCVIALNCTSRQGAFTGEGTPGAGCKLPCRQDALGSVQAELDSPVLGCEGNPLRDGGGS